MKIYVHLWYLAGFFLQREIILTKVIEEIKTHLMFNYFFPENLDIEVEKYFTSGQATDDNIIRRMHCMLVN
jgi:hypothetical protein